MFSTPISSIVLSTTRCQFAKTLTTKLHIDDKITNEATVARFIHFNLHPQHSWRRIERNPLMGIRSIIKKIHQNGRIFQGAGSGVAPLPFGYWVNCSADWTTQSQRLNRSTTIRSVSTTQTFRSLPQINPILMLHLGL